MSVIINPLVAGGATGGGSSTVVNNYNTIQNITNNSYTQTGNGILSGGGVVLTGGYGELAASAVYSIQGTTYTSVGGAGTIATADPANPRVDAFVYGIDGTASIITGAASSTPTIPYIDPTLYVANGFVLVPANSAPTITNEQIYQEDTGGPGEWNFTTSGTGITLNSTANPYTGATNIQIANASAGAYWQGARPSGSADTGQFNSFAFAFYPAAFANNQAITIQLYNSGVAVGNPIVFKNGSQNFNAAQASYQIPIYPTSVFGAAGVAFNQIRFTANRAGLSGSFDYCFFQSAVVPVNAPAPMVFKDVWNTTNAYNTNDVVLVGTLNNVTAYVALQPNVNQVPGTATTIWRQISQSTLVPIAIGAGSTNITHATYSNRLVKVIQAGATGVVFAGTATSGAVDGDEVYILNEGAGTCTMSGAVDAAPGCTLSIVPNALGYAIYNANSDRYLSQTLNSSLVGGGTVTTVSVVTANGVSGSVANPTTTPAITLNVDTAIANYLSTFDAKPAVAYATAAALPSNNYANGTLGVGATLTGTANGPLLIDGVTLAVGAVGLNVLVGNEATGSRNGWFTITQVGVVAVSPYILTRSTGSDQAAEIGPGYLTAVEAPSALTPGTNNGAVFISIAPVPFVVGTDTVTFGRVGGTGTVTSVSVVTANGFSGTVATATSTPAITIVPVAPTVTALSISSGVVNIDCSLGDYFTLTLSANVTSITFSNLPGSGKGATKWIQFTQGSGPFTVAWPASFKWQGGTVVNVSTANGAIDEAGITTVDNGTTWKIALGQAWA